MEKSLIYYQFYKSPIGLIKIIADDNYILEISFCKQKGTSKTNPNKVINLLIKQFDEYFKGKRQYFDVPCLLITTKFQTNVLKQVAKILYGKTKSYQEIAKALKNPLASRAVGAANRNNPLPLVIPCHRVIGSDGSLTGYAGGLDKKEFLLNLEKKYQK